MAVRIALVGNPNCGKTTMFNALTGASQYVGNWPGVTVEKKEGYLKGDKDVIITDLPGIYSLSPYTLEEVVSRDYLINEKPEAIINLVDATNIERNLYLTTQVLEVGIPVVIALNMMDIIKKRGDRIDIKKLSAQLGCEVVETSALHEKGLKELVASAKKLANAHKSVKPEKKFSESVEKAISEAEALLPMGTITEAQKRWYAIKFIERDSKVLESIALNASAKSSIATISERLEKEFDDTAESVITNERYEYIVNVVSSCVQKPKGKVSTSDKIDRIVTSRIFGIPIFIAVMAFVYWISVGAGFGTMGTDWVNDGLFGDIIPPAVTEALTNAGASEVLIDVIVNGIIGGLGSVLGFLPQMAVLFLCLSILEDVGYMARVAFVMDRLFRHFGLSGKSFIPLIIGAGCGIPGIQASRTIENDNDRRLTIMTATYIPCGAKLPVIALLEGVIFGGSWYLASIMYFVGIVAVLVVAVILKKTKAFHGQAAPFVMELPEYHIPAAKTVLMHVWERVWSFLKKAGTVLFLACIVMWFISSYGVENGSFGLVEDAAHSIIAGIGSVFAPLFTPAGFGSWQAVASSLSGFVAKESIVSTMSILAMAGEELAEDDAALWQGVQAFFPAATVGVAAFSFLLFNLLNSPCLAAISTGAKEMGSKGWTAFMIIFQNVFAYLMAVMVYQIGCLLVYGTFTLGTVVGFVILAALLFGLFRPDPYKDAKLEARRSVS
ncbi:MAG: ferrous iron transport protein B [Lachnospiraceae bacterium]|nr:ferrous iron transport protein B [Lachnospiraceae bacterium]